MTSRQRSSRRSKSGEIATNKEVNMGQLAGTVFGMGSPTIYPVPQNLSGFSPFAGQGFGIQAFPQQPYVQTPLNPLTAGNYGIAPYGTATVSPMQQIAQLLQIVPQQLQQLQILQQQQQLQLQHLLQLVPAQLQQIQQLVQSIQFGPQGQQFQQPWQPFGAGISGPLGVGLAPQTFAGHTASHVM
jgi:hypothetical protein